MQQVHFRFASSFSLTLFSMSNSNNVRAFSKIQVHGQWRGQLRRIPRNYLLLLYAEVFKTLAFTQFSSAICEPVYARHWCFDTLDVIAIILCICQAFEKFLYDSMALSTKLDEIRRRLLQDDYATDTSSIREQIHQNNHIKKWIVKAPIEILEEESNRVLDVIRDSCHCDNDDELSSEGLNALHQVRSMMETLFNQRTTLKELWQGRRDRLEKCLQFNIFKQDAETVCALLVIFTAFKTLRT